MTTEQKITNPVKSKLFYRAWQILISLFFAFIAAGFLDNLTFGVFTWIIVSILFDFIAFRLMGLKESTRVNEEDLRDGISFKDLDKYTSYIVKVKPICALLAIIPMFCLMPFLIVSLDITIIFNILYVSSFLITMTVSLLIKKVRFPYKIEHSNHNFLEQQRREEELSQLRKSESIPLRMELFGY